MKIFTSLIKIFFCVAFSFLAIFLLARSTQYLSGGFRLDKIAVILPKSNHNSCCDSILPIVKQPFFYLDKGSQAYVFESSDNKYVIKFIRFNRYRVPFWMRYCQYFHLDSYKKGREDHRKNRRVQSLNSYVFTDQFLKDETATVFTHLYQTNSLFNPMTLKDKLRRKFIVDLDNVGFIIQRKAIPLEKLFLECKKNQDLDGMRTYISLFLQMIERLYKKGFVVRDYNCVKNAGFVGDRVIMMDVGSFFYKQGLDDIDVFSNEITIFTKHFRKWANKYWPECLSVFEKELKELIEKKG